MFRAIWRLFRGIGYLFVGRLDGFTNKVSSNPAAMRGTYNEIIREKRERINEYMGAVSSLIGEQEKKSLRLQTLTKEIEKLERLKSGAAAKAKEIATDLRAKNTNITNDEIKANADYMQCQSSFANFSSTLSEKMERVGELEGSIKDYAKRVSGHKVQLTNLKREIENLKSEAADAVADVISAQEESELNKVLAGISEDGTARELERMRDIRNQAKAEAKIASELAGTDHNRMEAEFEKFAVDHEANAEFDALIGLDESDDMKLDRLSDELNALKVKDGEAVAE